MRKNSRSKLLMAFALAVSCAALAPVARGAEFLLSSFEGDLATALGVDWTLGSFTPGPWTSAFVTTEASEGTQALQLFHNANQWEWGLQLSTPQLIELVSTYDTLEFDVSPSLETGYRQVFAIMQGDGLNWTQTPEITLAIGDGVTPANHVSISLSSPNPNNPDNNWKAAAQQSAGGWWQLFIGLQGNDYTEAPTISTTIDNIKFVRQSQGGDFDQDGDVDGADFVDWQQGESPNPLSAADLAAWKAGFGGGSSPIGAASSAVPEPATSALLATAVLAMRRRRRRS